MPRTQKEDGSLEAGKMGSNGTRNSARPGLRLVDPTARRVRLISELLTCRKFECNRNVCNRVNDTEFGRIVLNFTSSYF